MYSELRRGFYSALPLMIGFIPLAMILGAQASQKGQTSLTAYLMCAMNFAGGSEFAAVALWDVIPPAGMIMLTTFLINSRHIIMGAALAPYIRQESGLRVFFIYFVMCDETWALSMQDIQRRQLEHKGFSFGYHMGVGISIWLGWSWCAFFGAVIGNSLGDLSSYGFAIAFPATFIGLTIAMRPKKDLLLYLPIAVSFAGSALTAVYIDVNYSVGIGAVTGLTSAYYLHVWRERTGQLQNNSDLKLAAPDTLAPTPDSAQNSAPPTAADAADIAGAEPQAAAAATAAAAPATAGQSTAMPGKQN